MKGLNVRKPLHNKIKVSDKFSTTVATPRRTSDDFRQESCLR